MVYKITIEKSVTNEFEVESDSLDNALELGRDVFNHTPDPEVEFAFYQIKARGPDIDGKVVETEWEEL